MGAHFEVYEVPPYRHGGRDASPPNVTTEPEWRWRLRAGNGEIVAASEGYAGGEEAARRGIGDLLSAVLDTGAFKYTGADGDERLIRWDWKGVTVEGGTQG